MNITIIIFILSNFRLSSSPKIFFMIFFPSTLETTLAFFFVSSYIQHKNQRHMFLIARSRFLFFYYSYISLDLFFMRGCVCAEHYCVNVSTILTIRAWGLRGFFMKLLYCRKWKNWWFYGWWKPCKFLGDFSSYFFLMLKLNGWSFSEKF